MTIYYFNLILLSFYGVTWVYCERLHEQIYSSIEGGAACFRRLNGTHQAGCTTPDNGAVGVVQMIKGVSDAQWLMYNASAGPYMAVVSTSLFHDVVDLLMDHPENIAGVLIYDNTTNSASSFSQESRCPNEYSSAPESQCSSSSTSGSVWNEQGTGLLRRDIPFPLFFLPESRAEEIFKIEECYERYNLDKDNELSKPLCSVQLNSFMFAAVNSEVCLRRSASSAILTGTKVCDPLGDQNVYYSLFPRKVNETKKQIVTLVTARIDTASLFDGVSPGAASSVVGMATLITAAATLAKMIPIEDANLYDHNILFTLFNGEAFDYIGSQRVAYDISRGMWPPSAPLAAHDIDLHVELGQIGGSLPNYSLDKVWPLNAFVPNDNNIIEIKEFLDEMSTNINQFNMSISPEITPNLPPSSLHSFQRILKNITEVLITDHKETFTNMFYHSVLDDFDKINFVYHNISIGGNGTFITTNDLIANGTMKETEPQVKISWLATGLALTLYQKVTGKKYTGNENASAHLVDEILYCFLKSQACRLLLAADYATSSNSDENLPEKPAPLYVGVESWASTAPVFAGHLLALLTGKRTHDNHTACQQIQDPGLSYYWLRGWNHSGICIQTTMNFSQALSPAFIIPDYDMKSGIYSTWTESVWRSMTARVFVSAGGGGARVAAATGFCATALAALLTFWLLKHSRTIFINVPTGSINDDTAASGILRTVNC